MWSTFRSSISDIVATVAEEGSNVYSVALESKITPTPPPPSLNDNHRHRRRGQRVTRDSPKEKTRQKKVDERRTSAASSSPSSSPDATWSSFQSEFRGLVSLVTNEGANAFSTMESQFLETKSTSRPPPPPREKKRATKSKTVLGNISNNPFGKRPPSDPKPTPTKENLEKRVTGTPTGTDDRGWGAMSDLRGSIVNNIKKGTVALASFESKILEDTQPKKSDPVEYIEMQDFGPADGVDPSHQDECIFFSTDDFELEREDGEINGWAGELLDLVSIVVPEEDEKGANEEMVLKSPRLMKNDVTSLEDFIVKVNEEERKGLEASPSETLKIKPVELFPRDETDPQHSSYISTIEIQKEVGVDDYSVEEEEEVRWNKILCQPLPPDKEFEFDVAGRRNEIIQVLIYNPDIAECLKHLVPSKITNAEFWKRYSYYCEKLTEDHNGAQHDQEDEEKKNSEEEWEYEPDCPVLSESDYLHNVEEECDVLRHTLKTQSHTINELMVKGQKISSEKEHQLQTVLLEKQAEMKAMKFSLGHAKRHSAPLNILKIVEQDGIILRLKKIAKRKEEEREAFQDELNQVQLNASFDDEFKMHDEKLVIQLEESDLRNRELQDELEALKSNHNQKERSNNSTESNALKAQLVKLRAKLHRSESHTKNAKEVMDREDQTD